MFIRIYFAILQQEDDEHRKTKRKYDDQRNNILREGRCASNYGVLETYQLERQLSKIREIALDKFETKKYWKIETIFGGTDKNGPKIRESWE